MRVSVALMCGLGEVCEVFGVDQEFFFDSGESVGVVACCGRVVGRGGLAQGYRGVEGAQGSQVADVSDVEGSAGCEDLYGLVEYGGEVGGVGEVLGDGVEDDGVEVVFG
jgi:hypothetical protein